MISVRFTAVVATIAAVLTVATATASASTQTPASHTVALFGTKTLIAGIVVLLAVGGGVAYWVTQRK